MGADTGGVADAWTHEAIADRQAIVELIYRYGRAVDRIDAELGYSVWHADGTGDYGGYTASAREIIDMICVQHRKTVIHSHRMCNMIIELDGERAASETYVDFDLRFDKNDPTVGIEIFGDKMKQITGSGRYVDRWSKRQGRWGIDHRIVLIDFTELRDVVPGAIPTRGSRDRDDPSYAAFAGLPA